MAIKDRSASRGPGDARAKRRAGAPRLTALVAGVAAIVIALIGSSGVTAANAGPTSTPSISITALTPSTQKSGIAFTYKVSYACSNVSAGTCAASPTVTIPLGAAANWPVAVGASPLILNHSVVGGNLVIQLADLQEGTSGDIGITITPPNQTTPNGTTWTLKPTMTFPDGTPSVTTTGVTSTATAAPSIDVSKDSDADYFKPGDTVVWTIWWDCPLSGGSTGVEDLSGLRLVDTLPTGLTYLSSTPSGATVAGQTVSFALTPAQLSSRCSAGAGLPVPVTITARVNAGVADGTQLTNRVTATGTSLSGTTVTDIATAPVTVVSQFPGGGVTKRGYGPLLNSVGDGGYDLNLNGYRSATYPGPWLARGIAATPAANTFVTPASVETMKIEGVYEMAVTMPQAGMQFSLVDPMPCNTNQTGVNYSSYPVGGTLCQSPAFDPTMVTVSAGSTGGPVGIPDAFVPQARLTDGTVVDLLPQPTNATVLANGPQRRSYWVPGAAVGLVAELIFPRTAGMTNTVTTIDVGGYVDESRRAGDIIRNQGTLSSYQVGAGAAYATAPTSIGRIFVLEGPQIGVSKSYTVSTKTFSFATELFTNGPVAGDLTFVDRLPAGWSVTGAVTATAWRYSTDTSAGTIAATSSTVADPATGASILTVTVPRDAINRLLPTGKGDRFLIRVTVPSAPPFPGNYSNTVTANLNDPAVDNTVCTTGTKVAGTSGAAHSCQSTTTFTINPVPSSDAVRVSKSVKGSLDTTFKTFPAIGYVEATGGSASYRLTWTNKSYQTLGAVVAYDLLPRVGDTGTVQETLTQPRGSTFRPTLTAIAALPAGITAYYSTADNPCRPEVLSNAQNPGCVDNWLAVPANPTSALLSTVRALKFVSTATYAFDTGFDIDISMTTPALVNPEQVAWNTFATAQTNTATSTPLPPVESARVGIARSDYSHITIDKVVDKPTANVGDQLTYTVTAVNDGGRNLTDVTLRDTLPPGVTFVSASNGGTHANGIVTWNLAAMPLGQVFNFTIRVRATVPDGSTLVNRWGVDGPTPVTPQHPCPKDPTESCATTEIPRVALAYAKTSNPAPGTAVKPGDTITYSVTVSNPTGAASTSGKLADDLAAVLDKATLQGSPTLACSPAANACGQVVYDAATTSFTWSSSVAKPLAGGTVATITYAVTVNPDATGTVSNVLVEPGITVEHPILQFGKTVDKGANAYVSPGDKLTYTIAVTNTGGLASGPVTVFDDLTNVVDKADFDVASVTVSPAGAGMAAFDPATKRLTWTGSVAAGATVSVSYAVRVKPDAFGELRNAFVDKSIVNPVTASLQWRKTDPSGTLLAGAEWDLAPVDGGGQPTGAPRKVTDCTSAPCDPSVLDTDPAAGRFLLTGLIPGEYRLVETKAPAGFFLDATPIAVTVSSTAQTTLLPDVVNVQQAVPTLPLTGGVGSDQLLLAGAGLTVLTAGLIVWQHKRRRRA